MAVRPVYHWCTKEKDGYAGQIKHLVLFDMEKLVVNWLEFLFLAFIKHAHIERWIKNIILLFFKKIFWPGCGVTGDGA